MDIFNHINISFCEFIAWDFVRGSMVVSAHLDNDEVGGLLGLHVVFFGLAAIHGSCADAGV